MKELYPHQREIYDDSQRRDLKKFGLWMEMRTGKTPLSIRIAARNCEKILVIVPKPLIEQWQNSIKEWDDRQREWTVIGKEQFRINHKTLNAHHGIIIDECHRQAANYKSGFFKAFKWYADKHKPHTIIALSGTPYSNNSWSVYSLGLLLGRLWNWWEWSLRYFIKVRMGRREVPIQKKGIEGEMATILKGLGYTVRLKDVVDVPDDEIINEYFDLNAEQKKAIKDSFDPLPIVRFTKQHQIESGVLLGGDYGEDKIIPCEKTTRIKELIEENDKIAIVARYNNQVKMYADIARDLGREVFVINGETKNRHEIVEAVENVKECVVVINSSCSDGYSLKSVSVMVFASMSFSYVDYAQMLSRVKDMSKKTGNTYIHLITRDKDSVDKAIYESVKRKEDFNIAIFKK